MKAVTLTFSERDIETGDPPPESWACVDCGENTAPGVATRGQTYPGATWTVTDRCEIYAVTAEVWFKAGDPDGCLCIGCLEARLGRKLRAEDFDGDPFAHLPCTPRLRKRRKR